MQTRTINAALLLSIGLLLAPIGNTDEQNQTGINNIDVNSAREYVSTQENAVIMDVRTPVEYEMSHIPDALNINVQDETFAEMVGKLDRDKTYIVHCTKNPGNGRSSRALATLRELGFKNLYNLEGGYIAWKDADLPLTGASN